MKCLIKRGNLLLDNSGETMVEVLVAFTLLSIMLVVFAEGIAWATKSEVNASKSRRSADDSMKRCQTDIATGNFAVYPAGNVDLNGQLYRGEKSYVGEDGNIYTYVYYVYRPTE